MKYHPSFPAQPFDLLAEARDWVWGFERWYNHQHKHSALNFITPDQRHSGAATAVLAQRQAVYQAAKARHPERWSGPIRKWDLPEGVWLNPPKSAPPKEISTLKAA